MLPFLIGSPIFLDASLFKLKPPPLRTAAFCWFRSETEYIHFLAEQRRFWVLFRLDLNPAQP